MDMEDTFNGCVVLSREAFDPAAVFMDDIVDDGVLPYLSLAVDGLNDEGRGARAQLELRPEDVAANEPQPDTELPNVSLGQDHLEVVGWESSLLRKLRTYIGF